MKNRIKWKIFSILLAASVVTSLSVLPFVLGLHPDIAQLLTPTILLAQVIQTAIVFSIAIFVGLYLADRVGFGLPVLEATLAGKKPSGNLEIIFGVSIGMGVLAATLIVLFSLLFWQISRTLLDVEMSVATWKAFLASFYGGIAEEILCRLFLMTLLVWISSKIRKAKDGRPTAIGIWVSIVLSSVLFGLGHLPITAALIPLSPAVVVRAILLNGVAGIIFGWLYQKYGLESAMISHFSCDIMLHVVVPLVASLFG
jgi:membrane protease YdiL (CAAX protease family)